LNNGAGIDGLLKGRMGMQIDMPRSRTLDRKRSRPRRWIIPLAGGLFAAVLAVIGTPHVTWYLRAALALIAFAYIAGQSATYLWSNAADQG
jgi:hypothetical protein